MSYNLCACRFEIITFTFMNTSGNIPRQTRVEMDERGWLRSNSENSVYHLKLRYTNAYDFIMTKSCMWYNYDKTFCFCYSIHSWSTEFKWLFFFWNFMAPQMCGELVTPTQIFTNAKRKGFNQKVWIQMKLNPVYFWTI